jgi:hypothetical protein
MPDVRYLNAYAAPAQEDLYFRTGRKLAENARNERNRPDQTHLVGPVVDLQFKPDPGVVFGDRSWTTYAWH